MIKPATNETLAFARGLDKAELAGIASMLLFDVASGETDPQPVFDQFHAALREAW